MNSQHPDIENILFQPDQLRTRVNELGQILAQAYANLDRPLLAVGILKGSFIFLADLLRALPLPVEVDLLAVSSYGASTRSSGAVRLLMDADADMDNRDVLVVEDIVDTGLTLSYLLDNLNARHPRSLAVCTLLDKPSRRQVDVKVDYRGFTIPDEFVVGYGLDYAQGYRNLPFIGVLKKAIYESGNQAAKT
ncbi:MAG: hypoxanthine phosphoribosyltransferase [Candidatus Latescibacteria bacterium]|nr:hypoxanthine phosphoribosyltransferase [Candidatus Latescibacterota bacterium]